MASSVIVKPVIDLRWISALTIFSIGILSGVSVCTAFFVSLKVVPNEPVGITMSYGDLAAITLTAIGVLVTILSVGIALMAFVGRFQIIKNAQKVASTAANLSAKAKVEELLGENGELRKLLLQHVKDEIKSPHFRKAISEELKLAMSIDTIVDGNLSSKNQDRFGNENDEYGDD